MNRTLPAVFICSALLCAGCGGGGQPDMGNGAEGTAAIAADFEPVYLELHRSGELKERAAAMWELMESCNLCPRECGINRLDGQTGFCRAPGTRLFIASSHPHFGEERPLVGSGGSGTIFFSHCGLRCVFCINWRISHLGRGYARDVEQLADKMLRLQRAGCHNINFVTPTHYAGHILKALDIAAGRGLRLPVVYNTCGWERMEVLDILDGVVDIYLPDIKFFDSLTAEKYSEGASSYPAVTKEAVLEMHRQVGVAKPAEDGIMYRGLMIRHLVMPDDAGGSKELLEWIASNLPKDTYINLMSQYSPAHKAYDFPRISRRVTAEEYAGVVNRAKELGFTNLDIQGFRWLGR